MKCEHGYVYECPYCKRESAPAPAACSACRHCGPAIGDRIRCHHPFWNEIGEPEDSDMRELHPSFAEECEDYELPNDKGINGAKQ